MRSSCTSAQAWISSSALTAVSTASARGPCSRRRRARQPHQAKVGPDPLAAAQREVGQRVHRRGEGLRELGQFRAPVREIAPEQDLDVPVHGGIDVGVLVEALHGHRPSCAFDLRHTRSG